MIPPFTPQQFLEVFVRYNEAVWPAQLALNGVALAVLALLFAPPGRAIAALLAVLWAWTGIAYHFLFFREINAAATLFGALFLAGAGVFAWEGVVRNRLTFAWSAGLRGAAGLALALYALAVYPLVALNLGRAYPAMPTFGAPCPTTIFTLGVLAFLRPPCRAHVFIAPLLWAVVGSQVAFFFGIYEDLGLVAAGAAAAVFALKRRA